MYTQDKFIKEISIEDATNVAGSGNVLISTRALIYPNVTNVFGIGSGLDVLHSADMPQTNMLQGIGPA